MFGDVLSLAHVVVFQWCSGGVPVVFWWYGRNGVFLSEMVPRTIPNWRQRRWETLLLGLYAGLIYFMILYDRRKFRS